MIASDPIMEQELPMASDSVARVLRGDLGPFEQIVSQYHSRVFSFLLRMVRHHHEAEDLTQQTFIKAYQAFASYEPDRPLLNWLLTIARNNALNFFRAQKPWEPLSEELPANGHSPDVAAEERDGTDYLWDRVRALLPQRQFEILWLRYGEDLSVKETAEVVGLSQTHVKILVFRARHALLKGEIRL